MLMQAPTGERMDVPDSLVTHYTSRGAVVVQAPTSGGMLSARGHQALSDFGRLTSAGGIGAAGGTEEHPGMGMMSSDQQDAVRSSALQGAAWNVGGAVVPAMAAMPFQSPAVRAFASAFLPRLPYPIGPMFRAVGAGMKAAGKVAPEAAAPAEAVAEEAPQAAKATGKVAGRIRPGSKPTAEVSGKAAREAAVRQRTIARPQRGASGPELARRAKMFAKTAESAPEDMATTLGKSVRLEQEMQKLGLTPAQRALARQAVASDPNGIGKLLGASLFGGLTGKPPPDSVRINEHWRRRPGRKETR